MPRIFLPAVTAKNNALLAGDTQAPNADFEFQQSDHDDSSTEDESTSPDLLRPVCHKRAQPPQQHPEVADGPAAATALVAAGNKRARVQDGPRADEVHEVDQQRPQQSHVNGQTSSTHTDTQGQSEQWEGEAFAVVFMTVALGITLAAPPSSDPNPSLVVCDMMDTTDDKICVGDRLVAVGGTSAAGLSVDRVQRLIVRGSRPLEITFRRRRSTSTSTSGGGASATKPQRPLGGLEPPSRDCLLDTISNIATQEDCLLPDSQPQWPVHQRDTHAGLVTGVSGRGRSENGDQEGGDPSPPPRGDTGRPSSSLSPPSPPLLSSLPPRRSSAAGGGDGNGHPERQALLYRPGGSPTSAHASPAFSSSFSFADADLLSPSVEGRAAQAAIPAAAAAVVAGSPSPASRPRIARTEAATPVVLGPSDVSGAPEVLASAEPAPFAQGLALTPGGSGRIAGTATEPGPKRPKCSKKQKNNKKSGRSASMTAAASAAISPRQLVGYGRGFNTANANNNNNNDGGNKAGLTGSSPSGGGSGGGSGGCGNSMIGGGGSGAGRQATAQASSSPAGASALVPDAAEVTRILAKLGARGVSELTLYKKLSFDELVRVCRYTGCIDLSKRLPKATMAERLNFLCVEQGVLALELRAAAGGQARTGDGGVAAGRARSVQEAGQLNGNGKALSTPVRPSAAPTPPPRQGVRPSDTSTEPPSVQFAASPLPLRRPSHAYDGGQAPPPFSRSSLVQTPLVTSVTTSRQQQQQRHHHHHHHHQLPLSRSPTTVREEHGGGGTARAEDDQHCWEDWDFPDKGNVRGRGRSGVPGREKRDCEASGTAGGLGIGGAAAADDGNEEAAWWSQEPDHRDWSPCSSPTAAAAAAAPPSRSFSASRFPPPPSASAPTSPSAGERSRDAEGGEGKGEQPPRRNPLLPPTLPSWALFAGQPQQQQQLGGIAQSLWSGRLSGGGLEFTALPKWILRSVRTIGTQVECAQVYGGPG